MKTVLYLQSGLGEDSFAKMDGVLRYAKAVDWRVQTVPYAMASLVTRPDASRLCCRWKTAIDRWKPAGVIVESGAICAELSVREFGKLPAVFLDREAERGAACVTSDAQAIAEAAARVLLPLKCAAYGYVPFSAPTYWSRDRGLRFAELIRCAGGDCRIFHTNVAAGDLERSYQALGRWLASAPRPFGVFAANDLMGSTVLDCAQTMRLKVPEDVAVIGVDDNKSICTHTKPPLSSVLPDHGRSGYVAAELLDACLAGTSARRRNATFGVLGTSRRASTFCVHRHDVRVVAAVEYIRRHACGSISLADVVKQMKCARRTAELRFGEIVGHSMLDEIHAVRLEYAKNRLRQTEASVQDVAAACGYRTTEQLRRLFLAAEGVSPRVWRQRAKG